MNNGYFWRVRAQSLTRFWINNVSRAEARMAIEAGAVGCTQNPSYCWKMLIHDEEKEYASGKLKEIMLAESDDNEVQVRLQRELVEKIAEIFRLVWEESGGRYGYVSIQGDPFHEDADTILRCARYNREAGPNIMVKVPATEHGLEAMEVLFAEGVPVNATEVFAIRQVTDVCEMYERVTRGMKNPAPTYFSHITGIYDEYLKNYVKKKKIDISSDVLWQAGLAVARKAYHYMKDRQYKVGFIGGGARGLQHFTEMVGGDVAITINWKGTADKLIAEDPPVVYRLFNPVPPQVIDELLIKVDEFKRGYISDAISPEEYEEFGPVVLFRSSFEKSWKNTLEEIGKRRAELKK